MKAFDILNHKSCRICGCDLVPHDGGMFCEAEGEYLCDECYDTETFRCQSCGNRFFNDHNCGDDNIDLCEHCIDNYCECTECGRLTHKNNTYWRKGDAYDDREPYCRNCYDKIFYKCTECDCVVRDDDACWYDGSPYCHDCYFNLLFQLL